MRFPGPRSVLLSALPVLCLLPPLPVAGQAQLRTVQQTASAPRCDIRSIRAYQERQQFPDLRGCTLRLAARLLPRQIGTAAVTRRPRPGIRADIILAQYPAPGAPLTRIRDKVRLTVSAPTPTPTPTPTPGPTPTRTPLPTPTPTQAPTPAADPAIFSVEDAPNAIEGTPLRFAITRSGPLADPATVAWSLGIADGPGEATEQDYPPRSGVAAFDSGKPMTIVEVGTRARPGANGPRRVHLFLNEVPGDGRIADNEGIGTIVDGREAPGFSVDDMTVDRGAPLAFTIRRTGDTAGSYSLAYAVEQPGYARELPQTLPRIRFEEGQTVASLPVDYASCSTGAVLTLSDPRPDAALTRATATATIAGALDASCSPPPSEPWWPWALAGAAALGVLAAAALGFRARHAIRERFSPARLLCAIDPEQGAIEPLATPRVSPPAGAVHVEIEEGELHMLNTPIVTPKEPDHG